MVKGFTITLGWTLWCRHEDEFNGNATTAAQGNRRANARKGVTMKHVSLAAVLLVGLVFGVAGATGETRAATHTFEHALGVAEIPTEPQRVAVLNIIALDAALSTGIVPVAAVINRDMPWRTDIDEIEVRLDIEVDVERLLQASPDLILHGAFGGELFGGLDPAVLERVAPVVAYDFRSDNEWPEYFLFFADALGRLEQSEGVLAAYEARVAALRERLGDSPPQVALLRVRPDALQNYTSGGFVARIFDDLGLPTWEMEGREFSLERVNEIDADVIYLFGSEDDREALEAEIARVTSNPVWQRHPAVQAGRAHAVGSYWFGFGPTEATLVLDDLERTLLE